MIGRTHGVHAEVMTFGLKLALWHAQLARDQRRLARARETIAVGQAVGGRRDLLAPRPRRRGGRVRRLGLRPAPIASQVLQRDQHAEVMTTLAICAASLETFATEIRALQKTEVRELEEPFGEKQKGSSAMPHKRNPVGCEQVTGLARLVRANALAALENVALWHERDISHSSVERVIVPDSFLALDHMLRRFTDIVRGLTVNADRMRRNLESGRGLVFSGQLLLELTARGMRREDAYRVVQAHAMEAWKTEGDFRKRVSEDPEIRAVLKDDEIADVFRLERYLAHVDAIFARVFASVSVLAGPADPGAASSASASWRPRTSRRASSRSCSGRFWPRRPAARRPRLDDRLVARGEAARHLRALPDRRLRGRSPARPCRTSWKTALDEALFVLSVAADHPGPHPRLRHPPRLVHDRVAAGGLGGPGRRVRPAPQQARHGGHRPHRGRSRSSSTSA